MKRLLLLLVFALTAGSASAQHIEFSPLLFGYATAAEFEPLVDRASTTAIDSGPTYGAQFGYLLTSHVEVGGSFSRRESGLSIDAPSSATTTLTFMTTNAVTGNLVYRFQRRANQLQPFMFAGGGVTRMAATDFDSESKLTWSLGGGLTWFMVKHIGIRADGRYNLVPLTNSNDPTCGPLTFCEDPIHSVNFTAGMALRF